MRCFVAITSSAAINPEVPPVAAHLIEAELDSSTIAMFAIYGSGCQGFLWFLAILSGTTGFFKYMLSNGTRSSHQVFGGQVLHLRVKESSQDCWDLRHLGVLWKLLHTLLKMIFNENLLCQLSWGNYHERLYKLLPEIPLSAWQTVKVKWNTFVLRNTGYHKASMQRLIQIWNLNLWK